MRVNKEIVLQNKLIVRHDVIEDGLKLVERETVIGSTKKRCDILFKDKRDSELYVEVKEDIDEKAIQQIQEYRTMVLNPKARFMLVANHPIDKTYKQQLNNLNIEFMSIHKDSIIVQSETIIEVLKGGSKYKIKENVLKKLNQQQRIGSEIFEYVSSQLHKNDMPILCNISDGIMFQIVNSNEKFLSISTIGNRILFHFPNGKRDEVYNNFKSSIPEIYCYKDKHPNERDKEQNQIDIKLMDIKNLEYIKQLIDEAYLKSIENY
ncbi:endonuclease NucS domain-containing protein [Pseudoneobacillus sp. C159]